MQTRNHPTYQTHFTFHGSLLGLGGRSPAANMHELSGCWESVWECQWCLSPSHLCSLQAELTVDTSVRGLLSVLPILSEKHSGTLLNWEGKAIPW